MTSTLRAAIEEAIAKASFVPVQVKTTLSFGWAADTMIALPVPVWERLVEAFDEDSS